MVLVTLVFDTLVVTEYSVWLSKCGHLMVGEGNPSLTHTQVKTFD